MLDIIVVDDGSRDRTAAVAAAAGARVIELARNHGKAAAVAAGIAASGAPDVYLLIDADLGDSAELAGELLGPVARGEADMTIAVFDAAATKGGFGLVKAFAVRVLRSETGLELAEPLSGQRAVRGPLLRSLQLAPRFGLEIGLTLDATDRGARIGEVEIGFRHRPTGRDLNGFVHRARIGRSVYLAAAARIGWPKAFGALVATLLGRMIGVSRRAAVRVRGRRRGVRRTWQRARRLWPARAPKEPAPRRRLRRRRERGQ